MSAYDDIIGSYNDIIGQQAGAFDGCAWPPSYVAVGQADPNAQVVGPQGPMACYPPYGYGPMVAPDPNALATLLAAKHSKLVAPRVPARARREVLGFDRVCVGPCETVTIDASPQVLFRPDKLVIPSSIAFQFLISNIKFGKWNLFANGGSVPAAAFIETAEDTRFLGDTVQPSGLVSLTVTNTSNAEAEFQAVIWGDAIE